MKATKIEWSHCGGASVLACFDCGTTEGLVLINGRGDGCVGGGEEVRCGLCWAKRHLREISLLNGNIDDLLRND